MFQCVDGGFERAHRGEHLLGRDRIGRAVLDRIGERLELREQRIRSIEDDLLLRVEVCGAEPGGRTVGVRTGVVTGRGATLTTARMWSSSDGDAPRGSFDRSFGPSSVIASPASRRRPPASR